MTKARAEILRCQVRSFFLKDYEYPTLYQVYLARTIKILDLFIRTDINPSVDNHLQTSKEVIEKFEQLRVELNQSKQEQRTE